MYEYLNVDEGVVESRFWFLSKVEDKRFEVFDGRNRISMQINGFREELYSKPSFFQQLLKLRRYVLT